MHEAAALNAFDALSQRTRLQSLRLLVRAGEAGLAAGDVARALDVPHNTMSSHLAALSAAGLAASERRGRTIMYRARYDTLRALIAFLTHDCCAGVPEIAGDARADPEVCFEKGDCA